jgi:hypothetical protein
MNTGVITAIDKAQLSGKLIQDSNGTEIAWVDSTPPAELGLQDRVTYTLTTDDPPVAQNIEHLAPGEVLGSGPHRGNKRVGPGQSLTLTDGAVLDGNIRNSGGTVIVTGGSTVDGRITSGDQGTLLIDGGSTIKGKVIIDENKLLDTKNATYEKNVAVSDTETVRMGENTTLNGGNVRINGAGNTDLSGVTLNGGNLIIDNGSGTGGIAIRSSANKETKLNGGNLRVAGAGSFSMEGAVINGGNVRIAGTSSTSSNDIKLNGGNLSIEDSPLVEITETRMTNANNSANRHIRVTNATTVNATDNTFTQSVLKTEGCSDITLSGNTFIQNSNTKRVRSRHEDVKTSFTATGENMGSSNLRVANNIDETGSFKPTCAVSITKVVAASRIRVDSGATVTVTNCATTLNAAGDNNVNIVVADSTSATVTNCTIAGSLKGLANGSVNFTGNTIAGDLIVEGTIGDCVSTPNTVKGNDKGC